MRIGTNEIEKVSTILCKKNDFYGQLSMTGNKLNRTQNSDGPENGAPLVSIITVVYNGIQGIEETILSVKNHLRKDVQYIIIDGGSTDGTVEIIAKYKSILDCWVSEPDKGIYDALNKGIDLAKGHFFYVLNVGDTVIDFPYPELLEARRNHADVVLFDVLFSDGRVFKSVIDYRTRFGNTIHHQGAFYRRELNVIYNLAYKVYSDFDVNQKLFLQRKKFIRYDKLISRHSLDGVSNNRQYISEYFSVINKNFGFIWTFVGFLYLKQGELRKFISDRLNAKSDIK
jgi:glycosyltransferase involved in cell wall biosynthesis